MKKVLLGIFIGVLATLLGQWTLGAIDYYRTPKQVIYSQQSADERARKHLWEYAEAHNIPIREFKGPYFKPILGLEYTPYIVFYKHPKYYLEFDDYGNDGFVVPWREVNMDSRRVQWLLEQP